MLKPSLYALYKQGRFRRSGSEQKEAQEQKERFAVAMLAFVLEHDLEFRKDFLEQVCERTHADDAKDFRVELEIPNCGDLVLRKRDNSEGCAFEIKVGAPVQDWNQNPRKRRFFTSGYGYGIRQQLWGKSTYILLQNEKLDFSDVRESPPVCRGRSWRDVSGIPYERRPIVRDLFESFGNLNIPAFIHMNTKNISLGHADATLDAVKLYKLLQAVAGVVGSKEKFEVALDEDKQGGSMGINFVPTENREEWHQLVQPNDDLVGWFGYSQDKKHKRSTLDVWFYCGKAAAAVNIRSLLRKRFPKAKVPRDASELPGENDVWISLPAGNSKDNQDWFICVFDSLIKRK